MKIPNKLMLLFVIATAMALQTVKAQVLPTTTGVTLFCNGSGMDLGDPGTGFQWIVRYSATQTTTPSTGVTVSAGNSIASNDLKTGYFYLIKQATAAGSCESSPQEIPVYVFAPIVVDFTATDYCEEAPVAQTSNITNSDPNANVAPLTYQWYTVTTSNVTAINGATQANYTPTITTPGTTTKYRLKVGYSVGGNRYCGEFVDKDVTVKAKPTKPAITVSGAATW